MLSLVLKIINKRIGKHKLCPVFNGTAKRNKNTQLVCLWSDILLVKRTSRIEKVLLIHVILKAAIRLGNILMIFHDHYYNHFCEVHSNSEIF